MTGPAASLEGLRVLVLEDEILVALLIEDALSDAGCRVVGPFASLEEAATALTAERPDAATLDVNVGGEEVLPLASRLAELGIPFLLVSGYDASHLAPAYRSWPLLQKPFDMGRLAALLADVVAGRWKPPG